MKKKILVSVIGILTIIAAYAYAQDRNAWLGHMFFTQMNPQIRYNGTIAFQTMTGGNLFRVSQTTQTPGLTFGDSGSAISQIRAYTQTLDPTAQTAWGSASSFNQTFTVTGLSLKDVVFVNGPAPTTACPMVAAMVSAANTLRLTFMQGTGTASCTPATGLYQVFSIRT